MGLEVEVLLPECALENEPDLLRSTLKASLIARFASIYRVKKLVIYKSRLDEKCTRLGRVLKTLLDYFIAPPYLKKKMFPLASELKYVGLAPPVQVPVHGVGESLVEGEVRAALAVGRRAGKLLVDVGLGKPVEAELGRGSAREGSLVYVRVVKASPLSLELVGEEELERAGVYTGYRTELVEDLGSYLESAKRSSYRLGTAREGDPVWLHLHQLARDLKKKGKVAVVFGEPYRGIHEIVSGLGLDASKLFDGVFNFIPRQGTRTVRLEEALSAVLQTIRLVEEGLSAQKAQGAAAYEA